MHKDANLNDRQNKHTMSATTDQHLARQFARSILSHESQTQQQFLNPSLQQQSLDFSTPQKPFFFLLNNNATKTHNKPAQQPPPSQPTFGRKFNPSPQFCQKYIPNHQQRQQQQPVYHHEVTTLPQQRQDQLFTEQVFSLENNITSTHEHLLYIMQQVDECITAYMRACNC